MTATARSPVELQADALVEEIRAKVAERRRELLDAAAHEASEICRLARMKARRQMRRAIEDMRATQRQRMQQVRAECETAQRRQASAHALEVLAAAWPRLSEAIERRWADAAARRRWIDAHVALARARLPAQGWVVRHSSAWADAEVCALRDLLLAQGANDATLLPDARVPIGLVIEVGNARLDSTPPALLADRALVEAALLAALETSGPQGRAP